MATKLYSDNGEFTFLSGGSVRASILPNGNLGIGVADPLYKLDIFGSSRTRGSPSQQLLGHYYNYYDLGQGNDVGGGQANQYILLVPQYTGSPTTGWR